ncbi:SDR family NAD(P)-dependent oxidoreductase [Bradyrhizobium sp. Leo121]|uniref:SDR family NAD(P)-dependent oxidoreductase n=1 Tax=Bradyrhizobium sp. Leo121 TaxID=1571195 RepID=UPI00102A8D04|nr:SDR family NAD(P)-dependent oxidoreductase [Bradyrhizobium sp. Leo121]RZN14089.1 3-oxoacyl-ACP reductase [Bradyrhizobium sp. Leo121]
MATRKTALIIGASRGLGLALAEEYCGRDYQVTATVRTPSKALDDLAARFPVSLEIETVDTTEPASVKALKQRLGNRIIDTLLVNAGICLARENTPIDADVNDFVAMMVTNALSPMRVVETFGDQVPPRGIIAVMSSELGSIAANRGFWELYSASKAALNMLMKCFSQRHPGDPRAMLLIAPGWVRTEMGGSQAILSIEESIPAVVTAVEARAGKSGLKFMSRHGDGLPW